MLPVGQRQVEPNLKASPYGAIQQVWMVRRGYKNHIAWQPINLEEQGIEDTLDFARFLAVLALLRKRIELVEEQDALTQPGILECFLNALRRLAEITVDHSLVSNYQKWHG
jgi:hypothetical protein